MRIFAPPFVIALLLVPAAQGYELGQSLGVAEDYSQWDPAMSGKASATLRSVEKYDYPRGGFSVAVDWVGTNQSWDALYSVQCIDDGAGATPSVFDFDADGGGTHYDIKQTAYAFTAPEAFMHNLYRTICKDVPGNLFP